MSADRPLSIACTPACDCHAPALDRREFLRTVGAAAIALGSAPGLSRIAGPFDERDFESLVPSDKKLSPAWLQSLVERGEPTIYRAADELQHIGMPVGGVGCGQLYVGGDGRLWHWDIFNLPPAREWRDSAGTLYAKPATAASPIEHGFALQVGTAQPRTLDARGFREVAFRGQYPIARVEYADPDCAVHVTLEAFSPFIPLATDDSSLPATLLEYTLLNKSSAPVEASLAGWIENPVALRSGAEGEGERRNTLVRGETIRYLRCTARPHAARAGTPRPDIVIERFENSRFAGWTAEGSAFGDGPVIARDMPSYMGPLGAQGERTAHSHNVRSGEDVGKADAHKGSLTSAPFVLERHYLTFLIGGGAHAGKTCMNLLIDGEVVRSASGPGANRMVPHTWNIAALEGRSAQLRIVDDESGSWGQISIDDIVLSDSPREPYERLEQRPDFGSLCLALLDDAGADIGSAAVSQQAAVPDAIFAGDAAPDADVARPFGQRLIGSIGRRVTLAPGQPVTLRFVLSWHFPRVWDDQLQHITGMKNLRRHYAAWFDSAAAVTRHVAENYDRLAQGTRLWRDTWYAGTLPHWLLERALVNVSTAATATCYRFDNGRFYAWEGTYCCAGTCTHVWQYAQALARIFPALERSTREMIDFGLAFHADSGAIDYRAEAHRIVAHDGQAGTILRAYREHQMSVDDAFLRRVWARVKSAIDHLIAGDADGDGLLEGAQYNTLDAAWYGPMAWLSSLYLAAVAAGEQMARDMHDDAFAARCRGIIERGSAALVAQLYNGEYFIHRPDPAHPEANNTNDGCHIDQVFGQSWAHQLGLPRVVPRAQSVSALRSLWKYSFTPDVGPYREKFKTIPGGRWYAMAGEGGLLMCTFPRGGGDRATGKGNDAWAASYFNECMSGFEYQVAAHMLAEGLVQEGLAVTRMIHDRYHAARRNPFNEIECSNHYARAMASYGVFLSACGFEYHGPRGHLAFAPRLSPENFSAPFTAAEGWGILHQSRTSSDSAAPAKQNPDRKGWTASDQRPVGNGGAASDKPPDRKAADSPVAARPSTGTTSVVAQTNEIEVRWGRLRLRTIGLSLAPDFQPTAAHVTLGEQQVDCTLTLDGATANIQLAREAVLAAGSLLRLRLG